MKNFDLGNASKEHSQAFSKKYISRKLQISTARLTEEKFIERNQICCLRNACFRHKEVTN